MNVLRKIRWMALLITALCLFAVVWVVVDPAAYTAGLIIVGAAAVLAYIGRNDW